MLQICAKWLTKRKLHCAHNSLEQSSTCSQDCNAKKCILLQIEGAVGFSVHLQILSFATEARYDYLSIAQTYLYGGTQYSTVVSK